MMKKPQIITSADYMLPHDQQWTTEEAATADATATAATPVSFVLSGTALQDGEGKDKDTSTTTVHSFNAVA